MRRAGQDQILLLRFSATTLARRALCSFSLSAPLHPGVVPAPFSDSVLAALAVEPVGDEITFATAEHATDGTPPRARLQIFGWAV